MLRNALIPVVTAAGLIVVGILAGAIYVEVTFALPGSRLARPSTRSRSATSRSIQGTTLLFAVFVVLVNLAIDVLYTLIDPRIRFGRVDVMTMPVELPMHARSASAAARTGPVSSPAASSRWSPCAPSSAS